VIGAGSLLEFALHSQTLHFPVGRTQFLFLHPLSFQEFLLALGEKELYAYLKKVTWEAPPFSEVHHKLLNLTKLYTQIGGMPAVVLKYLETRSILACQNLQTALLRAYREDLAKYTTQAAFRYLQRIYEKIPAFVAKRVKYVKLDPDVRSRELRVALDHLSLSGLIRKIHATSASGLPLALQADDNKFKLLFLDIGLWQRSLGIVHTSENGDLLDGYEGALAEQFVGQELIAYQPPTDEGTLYYWQREDGKIGAEIDYLTVIDNHLVPIEVKAGSKGKLKSLFQFLEGKKLERGVRISSAPLQLEGRIASIPFYLVGELARLLRPKQSKMGIS